MIPALPQPMRCALFISRTIGYETVMRVVWGICGVLLLAIPSRAEASDVFAVWQAWGAVHYQLGTDFGPSGPRVQSIAAEGGATIPFIGIEGVIRAGGAWGTDSSGVWAGARLGGSLGWRVPYIPELGFAEHQSLLVPSLGLSADAFVRGDGTTMGRGSAYVQNTSWLNCYVGVQIRAEVGFVPQPFSFAVGIGLVLGTRYYIDDGMYRCQ